MQEPPKHSHATDLGQTLRSRFGFDAFRPGQERLIRGVLSGRDALGVLPTGGGKTLCFQFPAAVLDGTVVVVSPLISLMKDQVGRARAMGLRARCVTSMDGRGEQKAALSAFADRALDMLFVSPERLATEGLKGLMASVPVALLAVDEAHCISEWGHDFRPAFRRISAVRHLVRGPVLAVTATATPAVRTDIASVLGLRRPVRVVTSFDRPNIFWDTRRVPQGAARAQRLIRVVADHDRLGHGAAIVYAPTRNQVVSLRRVLASMGLGAEAYHAGMTPDERKGVQERFLERASNLVVATNAFGMGIDRGDVGCVVHYGFPGSLESYYQEAGRAGRDGQPSRALAFVCRRDWRVPRGFVDRSFPSPGTVRRVLRRLRASSRRPGTGLRGRDLTGRFGAHLPALRWLIRAGAVDANEALERLAAGETYGESGETGLPVGRLTGRVPELGILAAARADALARLEAARRYTSSRGCRRRALLGYLGEVPEWSRCDGCDRCAGGGATPAK